MKTEKKNKKKDFDTVQTFRKIKDKISKLNPDHALANLFQTQITLK
jgi:hypothetical protein